jgi:hypothetical protein
MPVGYCALRELLFLKTLAVAKNVLMQDLTPLVLNCIVKSDGYKNRGLSPVVLVCSEKSPVADRQLLTFLVLPRKVSQRRRPRFAAALRFPALLVGSGGCRTCALRSYSPRRHPLTRLRYSAALRGMWRYAISIAANDCTHSATLFHSAQDCALNGLKSGFPLMA